ncbi:MAG: MBL fold metallo-hydrolase [Hyphomicrobiales bacterium]|nr:MBL fold metallo-hydrolase [Hyphomicrobiales bacterium]MCP5374130.1 MBL fold metallo-hydrolase [Hyphomicrobiales bacterium]
MPALGETLEVAPGVFWLRMPLPFALDHINLWLLRDGDGWVIVDTGIARDEVKAAWETIFAERLGGDPVTKVIVTHFHPDHMGLAGWLVERFGTALWTTFSEWAFARLARAQQSDDVRDSFLDFYRQAGFDADMLAGVDRRRGHYAARVLAPPAAVNRLVDGHAVEIDGRSWQVMVGTGHSPEHACLYCADLGVLISGDQILPKISPNISLWPQEPLGDPLRLYLESLPRFAGLPADTLVLPSHNWPFRGLHGRLDELAHHHDARLAETLAACDAPRTGVDILRRLFRRQLDDHQLFFAVGESLAHLHFLEGQGKVRRDRRDDGVFVFTRVS